ncbi:phenylacetaldehyde reductase-like isoform X2 [Henckelia pumila]|uniref:phenylacetaldehyde reductase-like isoform X2 n=1 Tax=Henckelia pumila TaxID=405737 RepID=UPI003C6E3D87
MVYYNSTSSKSLSYKVTNSKNSIIIVKVNHLQIISRMDSRSVCVTGASGYLASWLVKLLLRNGYAVKGTVRDLGEPNKIAHLKALEGAKERLQLFEADLIKEGSFDSIVHDCVGVFHTASPVLYSITDPQEQLIEPAVNGTLSLLKSCAKSPSIKRVVVTSSIAAVTLNRNPRGPGTVMDETWFSDIELCKETKQWYWLAKTLAEQSAVKYAEQNGIDLVVMNPGFVIGPLLQPTLNTSSRFILDLIKGKNVFPDYQFVDVRDVATAHVLAFENSSANGRYILVESSVSHDEAVQILHELISPSLDNPHKNTVTGNMTFKVSKKKAESLGLNFMPVEVSFRDMIQSLKHNNFLKKI